MTAPNTPPCDTWPPLPFAETTAWSESHTGRRIALAAAQAVEPLPAGVPFTGHPFCEERGGVDRGDGYGFILGCALAAGHSCPCRFTRRLP